MSQHHFTSNKIKKKFCGITKLVSKPQSRNKCTQKLHTDELHRAQFLRICQGITSLWSSVQNECCKLYSIHSCNIFISFVLLNE